MAVSPTPGNHLRFEPLERLLPDSGDIARLLAQLVQLATLVIAEPVSCGITLRQERGLMTVGSSDGLAEMLDETQYRTGGGPSAQSVQTGQPVEIIDLDREARWSEFVASARKTGLRCSLTLPLTVDGETLGAMNIYGFDSPDLFGSARRPALELFAAQAAGTLRVATRLSKDATLLAQLEQSLHSRTVIDQALGIVMRDQRCTATVAFDLLRRESQNSHRLLRDIAADLITRTTGAPPEPGRDFVPS